MVAAIRNAGGEVEYHVYDGEGHGFRRLTNVVDEYERTERFLTPSRAGCLDVIWGATST